MSAAAASSAGEEEEVVIPPEVFQATVGRPIALTRQDYRMLSEPKTTGSTKTFKKIVRFPNQKLPFFEELKQAAGLASIRRIPKDFDDESAGFYEMSTLTRLGQGAFGTTYALGSDKIVKFVETKGMQTIADFIMESLIQIVLWYEMCGPLAPPVPYGSRALVPRVYDLFSLPMRTADKFYFVIVMDRLDVSLSEYMYKSHVVSPSSLDPVTSRSCVAAMAMYQVGKTLQHLWETHQFSHGDLSISNVMAKLQDPSLGTNSNGLRLPQFYIIDFGTARMIYNGFLLHGASAIPDLHAPEHPSPSRDLLFFLFTIFTWTHCMPEKEDAEHRFIPVPEEFDCPETFRPELIHEFIRVFRSYGPQVYEKLRNGKYSGPYLSQLIRPDTSAISPTETPPPFQDMMDVAKGFLRSVAHSAEATEPFFFGRGRHRRRRF